MHAMLPWRGLDIDIVDWLGSIPSACTTGLQEHAPGRVILHC